MKYINMENALIEGRSLLCLGYIGQFLDDSLVTTLTTEITKKL
jgi:hypothetical protein